MQILIYHRVGTQWRFFNYKGFLDANELLRQLIIVITSYEAIRIKKFGVVCDG